MITHPAYSDLFLGYASRYGAPLPAHRSIWEHYLLPSMANCVTFWQHYRGARNGKGETFDFELGIVENKDYPNARCGWRAGRHMLLLYHTLPIALLELFSRLMNSPLVLSEIGDPFRVSSKTWSSPLGFAMFMGEAGKVNFADVLEVFGPECPERRATAIRLYQYAMNLVWEHEIAHAISGHVRFIQEAPGLTDIYHARPGDDSVEARHRRIVAHLELEADSGAMFSYINRPLMQAVQSPSYFSSDQVPAAINDVTLKILAGAFLAWFWMATDIVRADGDVNAPSVWSEHPSSLARALYFVHLPLGQADNLPEELVHVVREASVRSANHLMSLGGRWGLFRPFGWLNQQWLDEHIAPFMLSDEETNVLHDQIVQYRFISAVRG